MELRAARVQFMPDGSIEVAVTYAHGADLQPPNPGTKSRLRHARRGAVRALSIALADLGDADAADLHMVGFGTNTLVTTDTLAIGKGHRQDE